MNYNTITVKFKQKDLIEYKTLWNNQRWNEASLSLSLLASILFSQLFRDTFECQVHAETGRTMRLNLLLLLLTSCNFTKDMLAVSWEHKPNLIIIIHSIKYMRYAYCFASLELRDILESQCCFSYVYLYCSCIIHVITLKKYISIPCLSV